MRLYTFLYGLLLTPLVACGGQAPEPAPMQLSSPASTLTVQEQAVIFDMEARYGSSFYSEHSDCVEAVENGIAAECFFLTAVEHITRPEWEQLLPETLFYLVDISGWRSREGRLAHETQDWETTRYLAAWHNGQVYHVDGFDRLLEVNTITVHDTNRELVARSFALMSIPNYLGGEVRFPEWKRVDPGTYRHNYTHSLRAWTEIWGCEVFWWFVADDDRITTVTLSGGDCLINEYGNYVEDRRYFQFGDEDVPLGIPPSLQDYFFNR